MVVHCSTQNPTETQHVVAEALGPAHASGRLHLQADGGRLRRQGNARRNSRDDGGARGRENRPGGARHLQQRRRHVLDRQAARVPRRVGSRLRRRRPNSGLPRAVLFRRRRGGRSFDLGDGTHDAARRQFVLSSPTSISAARCASRIIRRTRPSAASAARRAWRRWRT